MSLSPRSPSNVIYALMTLSQLTPRRSVGFITREMGDSLAKRAAVSLAALYVRPDIACNFSNTLTRHCHLAPQTPFTIFFSLRPVTSTVSIAKEKSMCSLNRSARVGL